MQLHKQHQKSLTTLRDANKKDSKGKKSNGHIIKYLSIEKVRLKKENIWL